MSTAVHEAIRGRRSVGRVLPDPIGRERIERLLEAAAWAPTHKMREPWRFVVFTGAGREALGRAHARAVARANPATPAEGLTAQAALTLRAPVVVACVCRPGGDDPVVRREDRDAVAAAVQNMLLAAHADGLGAIWRTGAFVDEPEVRAHLGCTDAEDIVGFVYVGVPQAGGGGGEGVAVRRPVSEVTEWRTA
jgi:nitroreductase